MILYQIQDEKGQYSKGGWSTPSFSKNGKVWIGKAAFARHLADVLNKAYDDCHVIEIDCTTETFTRTPFIDWHSAYTADKLKKQQKADERRDAKKQNAIP